MAQLSNTTQQATSIYPPPPLYYNLYNQYDSQQFNTQYNTQLNDILHNNNNQFNKLYSIVPDELHHYIPPPIPDKYIKFGQLHKSTPYNPTQYINSSQLFHTLPSNIPWLYQNHDVQHKHNNNDDEQKNGNNDDNIDIYQPKYTPYTKLLKQLLCDCMNQYINTINILSKSQKPNNIDLHELKHRKTLYIGTQTTDNSYAIESILTQLTNITFNFTTLINQLRWYQAKSMIIQQQTMQLNKIRKYKYKLKQLIESNTALLDQHNVRYATDDAVIPIDITINKVNVNHDHTTDELMNDDNVIDELSQQVATTSSHSNEQDSTTHAKTSMKQLLDSL